MIAISRASRIVATPIVIASRGTNSSPKKSAAASLARDGVERHEARAAVRARARLVEADVPRLADAEDLEIDSAGARRWPPRTRCAASSTFSRRTSPGGMCTFSRIDVDVREQILPHEAVVGVDAVLRHRVVLVEIERHDAREAQPLVAVHADQLAVDADRRRAGREPKDESGRPPRCASRISVGDAQRDQLGDVVVVVGDDGADALARRVRGQK